MVPVALTVPIKLGCGTPPIVHTTVSTEPGVRPLNVTDPVHAPQAVGLTEVVVTVKPLETVTK